MIDAFTAHIRMTLHLLIQTFQTPNGFDNAQFSIGILVLDELLYFHGKITGLPIKDDFMLLPSHVLHLFRPFRSLWKCAST